MSVDSISPVVYAPGGKVKIRSGFSLLEVVATLAILAMVMVATLTILDNIRSKTIEIDKRMTRRRLIEHSIDWLMDDIASASLKDEIEVEYGSFGNGETSSVKIVRSSSGKTSWQIDWAAVPREERGDLVLYRREKRSGSKEKALYIPLCEDISTFTVELYDSEGQSLIDPNIPMQMVEIIADVYLDDYDYSDDFNDFGRDPERIMRVRRCFCRDRF